MSRTVRQTSSNDSMLSAFSLGASCAGSKPARARQKQQHAQHDASSIGTIYSCLDSPGTNGKISRLPSRKRTPGVDPLTVRFTDLYKWVTTLPDFADDPMKSNEAKLEAIQMAWLEE